MEYTDQQREIESGNSQQSKKIQKRINVEPKNPEEDLSRHSTKEDMKGTISTWRGTRHPQSSGRHKLKAQRESRHAYSPERPNERPKRTMPAASADAE